MKRHTERAESLIENLFSLEEPWRGRFLTLVAQRATRLAWDGQPPTRDEVAAWLNDASLSRAMTLLLDAWQGREEGGLLPVH